MPGYVREKLEILSGGFTALPPGDKISKADLTLCQNFRVDRPGKLISRFGYISKFSVSGPAYAHSGANMGADESAFYIGANAASGANPCTIHVDGSSTPIASGLSGHRVGFASVGGFMYVMDRNKQFRHNAGGLKNWTIAAPPPGSALTATAGAANPDGPNGDYNFFVTFATTDGFYETGPGPESAGVTVANQNVNFTGIPISPDPQVGVRKIYAIGGTLGEAYLVLTIPNNTATTGTWNTGDLDVIDDGIIMPVGRTDAPAGWGLAGPYFSRLYTWIGNRLYYTPPGQPQYWNTDSAVGDWVDVGNWGENIQWVTSHTNVLMIYKQKSIWRLIGDPLTGSLEQLEEGVGLCNPFAITSGAGAIDYFVSPNGLRRCNLDRSEPFGPEISPLFNTPLQNANTPLEAPGSILPGPDWISGADSLDAYAVSLGYAMSKLYLSYNENVPAGASAVTLVYDERTQKWVYHRTGLTTQRFWGFYFDGALMIGLTGNGTNAATGYNVDDYRLFFTLDEAAPVRSVYQSRYEDAAMPDNQKCWLEVVIEAYLQPGATATALMGLDNAIGLSTLGTITGSGARAPYHFDLGSGIADGVLAKNISIGLDFTSSASSGLCEIHNVYLYYYVEARLAVAAATLPTDLGTASVKECKELILDIDTSYGGGGTVGVDLRSDLPGNALATRQSPLVPVLGGRALYKFPFATTEGYLWRVALAANSRPFRLYSVRLLMREIGTYVEAYESAAGFVWDSLEESFDSLVTHVARGSTLAVGSSPIKWFRQLRLEMETYGGDVTVNFLTDLPGNAQAVRFTGTVNTNGSGRRYVGLPLPAGILPSIEGRACRLKLSGSSAYRLYKAEVELLVIGVYVEAYEAAGGAVYDSREMDFGSSKPKECREVELDIDTTGPVTATLYWDLPSYKMDQSMSFTVNTTGRQKILLPTTTDPAPFDYPVGRMFRLIITGTNAFRLYGARGKMKELGAYLTGDEAGATPAAVWDSTPIDLGTERVKEFKKLEFEMQTDGTAGTATVKVWTDQPNGYMTFQFTTTATTGGNHRSVKIPLTYGIRGRLLQVEVGGTGTRLYAGRVYWRPLNEPKAQWTWSPLPIPPTSTDTTSANFLVAPTPPGAAQGEQFVWGKFIEVRETDNAFQVVEVPFEVVG